MILLYEQVGCSYGRSISRNSRPFKEWPKVFPDALNAQVIAERLTERCEDFVLEKGYRPHAAKR